MMRLLFGLATVLLLAPPLAFPTVALAQGVEDLDAQRDSRSARRDRQSVMAQLENEVIREIVRGYYLKTGAGGGAYFGRYQGTLSTVIHAPITFGQDFVDKERMSMAWEVTILQAVYKGRPYQTQAQFDRPLIQGHTRMFNFLASYEYSAYPSRRFGIGVRVGGGLMVAPLLMDREAYERDVVGGTWGGLTTNAHSGVHPVVFAGPTLEYYTKLSHFSIGLDVDVAYQLNFDLNVSGVGFMKYTF